MITLSYGYGEFVNYEKYAENFFEDPLTLGLCHLYVGEVSGSVSVDKARHCRHFDMIFRCHLYSLQGTLADLEQQAQVLVAEKPHTLGKGRLLLLCLHAEQQLVLAVKPFEDSLHPVLEILSGKRFHDLLPPSVCLSVASRAERMVPADALRCAVFLRHRVLRDEAVYLREGVHAFSAERGVPDAVPVAHPLKGTPAGTQYPGGLGRIDLPVRRTGLLVLTFADMACYLRYLFRQRHVCGVFHCYHFHTQYFSFVSAAKFGNRQRGL